MGHLMMYVHRIEQRDQHVDIKQDGLHSSSRIRFTSFKVVGFAPGGRSSSRIPLRTFTVPRGCSAILNKSEITFPVL